MSVAVLVDRREFLKLGLAGTGGLLLGIALPSRLAAAAVGDAASTPVKLNAWVHIGTDDVVTFFIHNDSR